MKKIIAGVIAVSAAVGLYYAVHELGKLFDEESLDLFAEEPDVD